jgi:hypothetical protein
MEALLQKKKMWEFQNQQALMKLAEVLSDLSIESVKAAVRSTSFLLYLIYAGFSIVLMGFIRGMLAPKMVRRMGPHTRSEEVYEIHRHNLELQYRSRVSNNIIK